MPCCGSQRSAFHQASGESARPGSGYWAAGAREYSYTGNSQLTVTGPLTGTVYRFVAGGPPVRVHAADVASLAAVPHLKPAR